MSSDIVAIMNTLHLIDQIKWSDNDSKNKAKNWTVCKIKISEKNKNIL